jgi:hypothetical protein
MENQKTLQQKGRPYPIHGKASYRPQWASNNLQINISEHKKTLQSWSRIALSVACSLAVCSTSRNFCNSDSLTCKRARKHILVMSSMKNSESRTVSKITCKYHLLQGGAPRKEFVSK